MDASFHFSRRDFLAGLTAAAVVASRPLAGQTKPRLINVHHHLTAPAYVKFLTDNKVREFPIKSAAEGIEDMDKAGVTIALCSTIGPGIWFGNLADTRRLAREINDYAAKVLADYPGRLGMFIMLPLPDIDGSLKEIEYGFDKLQSRRRLHVHQLGASLSTETSIWEIPRWRLSMKS